MEPSAPAPAIRFPCTPGGAIARGRRRLGLLLVGLALFMGAFGLAAWIAERRMGSVLALAVAFAAWTSWRMSGDLDPLWLEVEPERLVLQLRRKRVIVPLLAPQARLLAPEEVRHVERLASRGLLVAGTGGFDSHLLGEFNLYASSLAGPVLVETGESRLVVSPDDASGFIARLASANMPRP